MERKTYLTWLIIVCTWLFLAGCTYNPLSDNNQLTGSATGTLVGAGIGAGSMALLNAPRPLIMAAGVGGAALGYYFTTLRFQSGGVVQAGGMVYTLGDYVTIEIPSDQLFDSNSAELLPQAEYILNSALSVLERYPDYNILVSGNTSGFGFRRDELQHSEDQARQVTTWLWAHGLNHCNGGPRKLIYVGYGSYFPISNNIRAKGIRENNRIQITGYPTNTKIHLDKCYKTFCQGSDLKDECPASPPPTFQPPAPDFNREFPVETPRHNYKADYKGNI
jgi:outer membrane protein OmpA-like peptidoglycan-associated protein